MAKGNFIPGILLYLFLLLPFISSAQTLSGKWETEFSLTDGTHQVVLLFNASDFANSQFSIYTDGSSISSLITDFSQSGLHVEFNLPADGIFGFSGEIENETSMKGIISINGNDYPVTFTKTSDEGAAVEDSFGFDDGQAFSDSANVIGGNELNSNDGSVADGTNTVNKPDRRVFIYTLLFWLVVFVIFFIITNKQKRSLSAQAGQPVKEDPGASEMINKVMPLVRLGRKHNDKKRAIIFSDNSFFLFKKKKNKSIAELHEHADHETIANFHGLHSVEEIPFEKVDQIGLETINRLGRTKLRFSATGKNYKFSFPSYELFHFVTALRLKFGDRFRENLPIRFHSWTLLITLAIIYSVTGYILGMGSLTITDNSGNAKAIYGFVSLVFGIILFLFAIPIILAVLEHLQAKKDHVPKKKKEKDRSHSQPFRSVILSFILRLIGITLLFIILLLKLYALSGEADIDTQALIAMPWFIFYIIIGLILSLSYALAQRNPNKLRAKHHKKLILYLRSFADDKETTLSKRTWLSYVLGVNPPYYFLERYDIGERTWLNRFLKHLIRFFYRFHPLFLVRLMFGSPKETSEQQLGKFLRKYGQFVAIGKPGEKIVTTGASRLYVTNEEWQQTVLDLLKESAFIVLQPSRTKGVWWEVEQTFRKEDPQKILLSLVNYHGFQDDYETFRLRMAELFPERPAFPRSIGNEPRIAFMGFNEKWEPQIYYLKNYWPVSWPFRGTTADLSQSLKPFIQSVKEEFSQSHT